MFKGKFLLMALVLAIASSLLTACSSRGKDTSSAAEKPAATAVQAREVLSDVNANPPSLIPVTGKTSIESAQAGVDANRLWSGEVSLSDNAYPDLRDKARFTRSRVQKLRASLRMAVRLAAKAVVLTSRRSL